MTTQRTLTMRIAGAVFALAAAVGIVHGSHVPVTLDPGEHAVLRVAFGARPERIEVCRDLSTEEQQALPAHMRQATSCDGTTARYHLEVRRDGQMISTAELRGGGLRSDRQLYLFREIRIPSGLSHLEVSLVRVDSIAMVTTTTLPDVAEPTPLDSARARRHDGEVPARLELQEDVTLAPHEVLLITYDAESRRLRTVRRAP